MQTFVPALLLLAAGAPALADDAAWLRCRALTEPVARLACYDAVQAGPASAPTTAPATDPAAAAAVAVVVPAEKQFGLEQKAGEPAQQIESSLPGPFDGWGPRQKFKLANGQVWQLVESRSGSYQLRDPKVTIRRAAFGSFLMEIEGVAQSLRVRRVE